ncbi:Conserved_hypothetical protein [Hexamita inflata]|uniref:Uncharacterized protein n=1 Tax=Hexamita inflata TaxID=28002 RepID=A0ABP1H9H9_9EUKA
MEFKRGELPEYLQRVYRSLLVNSKDIQLVPLFIDKSQCHLQLLLSSELQLQNPTMMKVNPFDLQSQLELDSRSHFSQSFIIKDEKMQVEEISFVPYKAYIVCQNFQKLNQAQEVKQSTYNQLLVSLSACFQEYCQKFQFHKTNAIIQQQKKVIDEQNRKMQLQIPYDVCRMEHTIQRLRTDCQKYQDLYQKTLSKKAINKRIHVQVGPVYKNKKESVEEELHQLRKLVQNQIENGTQIGYTQIQSQIGGSGKNVAGINSQHAQDVIHMGGPKTADFQAGCVAIGRVLMQIIELSLGRLYQMREANVQVVEVLKDCQKKCREVLLEVLEGRYEEED